jgi:molybdopterin/thiamine biosynthesis adenylyltransferase
VPVVEIMDSLYRSIFSRNIGFLTESEQGRLQRSSIAIAGMGGVGGLLAERLVRLGVGQLRITDPGNFEESNLNRQFGSSMLNLGQNKAAVVFNQIKDINPQAKIVCTDTGIRNDDDASLFVDGCDLVVDEMDLGSLRQSILLQRAARRQGKHYLFTSAIGFGALAVIFDPRGITLEEYNRLPPDVDLGGGGEVVVPRERGIPVIPSYVSGISEDTLNRIFAGEIPVPTTSIGVGLASTLAANEVINIILRKRDIVVAPGYIYIDLLDRRLVIGSV